eukprot:CAMPEP_0173092870 /NCGR_PEP_ID=MMETSP1102-20130122/29448_1 /TAXON_ID=49646 /ORGANISM="Geminigera sp., Strain Caron Lab Isolate" /LENGTH=30 /DNA_ID= /DNA_START= /DNA_END= /DNA_ORIENTATION=
MRAIPKARGLSGSGNSTMFTAVQALKDSTQ